ncbi:uncharacterized protein CTRU02_209281 [Colletotrichum truncatum]|uniref:Uncharacterized protein n=1 Tax=Colletotrichum truncatum TaxID=5467 RepID=A0ACC3YRZ0_COLTU|nr:uncharacterized protein CTRU02_08642 [Colletotrichum truncatum]KAF6789943.1 hypothetical protein CTRU02_08642 [Colletotrichum truncatum]
MPLPSRTRQACDRCHGQKLRCTKQVGSAICARCFKASVPCVYSPSGPQPVPQSLSLIDASFAAESAALEWGAFSFDQLLGPSNIPQVDTFFVEEGSSSQRTHEAAVNLRSQCFGRLSSVMVKVNEAFNGLPPVSKLHVPGPDLKLFCMQISESYNLKRSLELLLSQTQELADIYPIVIQLAFEQQHTPDCTLPQCVHTYKSHPTFGEDPFEIGVGSPKIDFTLLSQLISCHYRLHDTIELLASQAQVCFKISAASSHHGIESHRFDVPELRIGSFTLSSVTSSPAMATILVDLQFSLTQHIPKLQASIGRDGTREGKVLSLQCDMLKDRADSILVRLKTLRDAIISHGTTN